MHIPNAYTEDCKDQIMRARERQRTTYDIVYCTQHDKTEAFPEAYTEEREDQAEATGACSLHTPIESRCAMY